MTKKPTNPLLEQLKSDEEKKVEKAIFTLLGDPIPEFFNLLKEIESKWEDNPDVRGIIKSALKKENSNKNLEEKNPLEFLILSGKLSLSQLVELSTKEDIKNSISPEKLNETILTFLKNSPRLKLTHYYDLALEKKIPSELLINLINHTTLFSSLDEKDLIEVSLKYNDLDVWQATKKAIDRFLERLSQS